MIALDFDFDFDFDLELKDFLKKKENMIRA